MPELSRQETNEKSPTSVVRNSTASAADLSGVLAPGLEQLPQVTTPAALLYLQRTAGNAATCQLLRDRGVIQRQEATASSAHPRGPREPSPPTRAPGRPSDAGRELAARVLGRLQAGGVTVAVHGSGIQSDFGTQANQFAADHGAVGMDGGALRENVAMALTRPLPDLLAEVSAGTQHLLAMHADLADGQSMRFAVQTLAIFTHGLSNQLQAGRPDQRDHAQWIMNDLRPWVDQIAPYLAPSPQVLLYACLTANRTPATPQPFAEAMDEYLQADLEARYPGRPVAPEVWGHITGGHSTRNPLLRAFGGQRRGRPLTLHEDLGNRLASLALARANRADADTDPSLRASLEQLRERASTAISVGLRDLPNRPDDNPQDPTNAFVREIPMMGVDRLWRDLISEAAPDYSDLDLSEPARARVAAGLLEMRRRLDLGHRLAELQTQVRGWPPGAQVVGTARSDRNPGAETGTH